MATGMTDRELAIRFVELIDPAEKEKLVSDDFTWWTSYHHGPMTFKELKAMVTDLAMPVTMTKELIGVAGERGRIAIEVQGRCQLPDGRRYDNNYCFVVVVENGRVKEMREYCDTLLAANTFNRPDIADYTRKIAETAHP